MRVRDLTQNPSNLPTGPTNTILDVIGVSVSHLTLIKGDNIRTGATCIKSHQGDVYRERVPAAIFVGNGFGKLTGSTQVNELGELETPILLTNTLSVPEAAKALIKYTIQTSPEKNIVSINPVVGETNDSVLNDIRAMAITGDMFQELLNQVESSDPLEGSVGAGTGTVAFGWKGGIGSSSRMVRVADEVFTLGVLVQTNFGGELRVYGTPISKGYGKPNADGSILIVIATDAPLDQRNLSRIGARAMSGLARTGSSMSNGSGDYAIVFSTDLGNRTHRADELKIGTIRMIPNTLMSTFFLAAIEAVEEAILNSLITADEMTGNGATIRKAPIEQILQNGIK